MFGERCISFVHQGRILKVIGEGVRDSSLLAHVMLTLDAFMGAGPIAKACLRTALGHIS
jgi:hypothetical protein